jgi:hypothetical protein
VTGSTFVRPLALSPDAIADFVERTLVEGAGGWSLGVQGALAEFAVLPDEHADVVRAGRTVAAVTAGGGIRLAITADTVAFGTGDDVTLAVPRSTLAAPGRGVFLMPADPGALRPVDTTGVLVDLAVGHAAAAFCVRSADPDLVELLRGLEGRPWRQALAAAGHRLVAASPHRVVLGPRGRIEVYNPIPVQADASPPGCHTHLLPALLATGREMPEGRELPAQLVAAGNWTNPGWGEEFTLVKSPPT